MEINRWFIIRMMVMSNASFVVGYDRRRSGLYMHQSIENMTTTVVTEI